MSPGQAVLVDEKNVESVMAAQSAADIPDNPQPTMTTS
jgi:hypothetical protein